MASLPADPREDGAIEMVDKEDLEPFIQNSMLRTKLQDFILCYVGCPSTTIHSIIFALEIL